MTCTFVSKKRALSSDRQYLSYDVCLEVRGEIIRTVLCCIRQLCTIISNLDEQFLQFSGLGFVTLSAFHSFTVHSLDLVVFICVYFVLLFFITHMCCAIVSTVGWT